ncbi:hypothetical protein CDD83_1089 [Cordyceps sp. RAO-2017]|nr:hypothetical protein CDD83_1089 [Cordyceps sp. RAO-2017]
MFRPADGDEPGPGCRSRAKPEADDSRCGGGVAPAESGGGWAKRRLPTSYDRPDCSLAVLRRARVVTQVVWAPSDPYVPETSSCPPDPTPASRSVPHEAGPFSPLLPLPIGILTCCVELRSDGWQDLPPRSRQQSHARDWRPGHVDRVGLSLGGTNGDGDEVAGGLHRPGGCGGRAGKTHGAARPSLVPWLLCRRPLRGGGAPNASRRPPDAWDGEARAIVRDGPVTSQVQAYGALKRQDPRTLTGGPRPSVLFVTVAIDALAAAAAPRPRPEASSQQQQQQQPTASSSRRRRPVQAGLSRASTPPPPQPPIPPPPPQPAPSPFARLLLRPGKSKQRPSVSVASYRLSGRACVGSALRHSPSGIAIGLSRQVAARDGAAQETLFDGRPRPPRSCDAQQVADRDLLAASLCFEEALVTR